MAPLELKAENLGGIHRDYNKVFQEQAVTKKLNEELKLEEDDLNNFLKIDVANNNKDVEYILKVLQSNDLLYVVRALANCTWLITGQEYADIINPKYLESELYPNMTTKARIKFKKYIRHNINDEKRAEMFYLDEKSKLEAAKWLPHCSVAFVEKNIKNHEITSRGDGIKVRLFKRLCEKSITIFEIIMNQLKDYERPEYLNAVTFLLNTNTDKYLDVVEKNEYRYGGVTFNHNATDLIMKHSQQRIIDKIEKYVTMIHIPTFVKHLKADEIKIFLSSQAKKDDTIYESSNLNYLFEIDNMKHFIRKLPKSEQFDFVRSSCMMIADENEEKLARSEDLMLKRRCSERNRQNYIWYQFAPFDLAFKETTKLLSHPEDSYEKRQMLFSLMECADKNLEHVQAILNYYLNKYKNEEMYEKQTFVSELLNRCILIGKCDSNTWKLLNELFTALKINDAKSDYGYQTQDIIDFITVYNVINDLKVPENIEKQFSFDASSPKDKSGMNQEQKDKLFNYKYEHFMSRLKKSITTEEEFTESIPILENVLNLIKNWKKSLLDYLIILNKIRELINLKKTNSWKDNLSCLYNVNKAWRKYMFEESVILCPNEEVCLNALKHDPSLLTRHEEEIEKLRTDKAVTLNRLISKLRIYWSRSLGQQWINAYLNKIQEPNPQNSAIRSLCTMLSEKQLLDIIEKYKPTSPKIDWKQIDENVLSVQRYLAKNMHRGRPQPIPDAILSYALGDYLQFALPSLLAIFYNLKPPLMQEYIPKLLNSPVSVQKHGIRVAFEKFSHEKLMEIFLHSWQSTKNVSIHAIIFKYTFTMLCSEKDPIIADSIWELLDKFLDQLTYTEDKSVYETLSKVQDVPLNVRAKFLQKSYEFFQRLIPNVKENDRSNYENYCAHLSAYSKHLMDTINPEFITNLIQDFIKTNFFEAEIKSIYNLDGMQRVISIYILHSETEEHQMEKYKNVLEPLIKQSIKEWNKKSESKYFVRRRFQQLLSYLTSDLKYYVVSKSLLIPLKIYSLIQTELQNSLSITENYILLTKWKLTVTIATLLNKITPLEESIEKIAPEFGNICLDLLKKDIAAHFPCIYILFAKCLKSLIDEIMDNKAVLKIYDALTSDEQFLHGYLLFVEIADAHSKCDYEEMWNRLLTHPSAEIKMHYYNKIEQPI